MNKNIVQIEALNNVLLSPALGTSILVSDVGETEKIVIWLFPVIPFSITSQIKSSQRDIFRYWLI